MTKSEAHARFLKWIEEHPSDEWVITGGDVPGLCEYSATAVMTNDDVFAFDSIIYRYDRGRK